MSETAVLPSPAPDVVGLPPIPGPDTAVGQQPILVAPGVNGAGPDSDTKTQEREAKAATQQEEIGRVVNALMLQRGKALVDMDPQQRNAAYEADPANRDIVTFYRLSSIASSRVFRTAEKPYGEPAVSDNRPMIITINGERRMITFLDSTDGKQFFVRTVPEGGKPGGKGERLEEEGRSIQEIFNAQLLAVGETLLNSQQFSADERAVLELYIGQMAGDQGIIDKLGTAEVDGFIQRAARGVLLTTQDLRALVDVQLPQAGRRNPDGTMAALTPAEAQQRDTALKLLEGKNLADFDTTVVVLKGLGITQEGLGQEAVALEGRVKAIQDKLRLATGAEKESLEEALELAQDQVKLLRQAASAFDKDGALDQYFASVDRGEVDLAKTKKFSESLRTGNVKEAILAIVPEDPNDLPEARALKKRQRKAMEDLISQGKNIGIGLLVLLFLGNMGYSSLTKQERQ